MTTHDALLPAAVLQRKAVVYVRHSTPQQVQSNLESQRRQYELVEVARRPTILVALRAAPSNGPASIAWSPPCAPDRLARCCVSMPRGSHAMGVTGIICSSCADWWRPASSTLMAYTTRAGRTIACCSV
jgi:hypothetical protein